jgi:hypothetical protein
MGGGFAIQTAGSLAGGSTTPQQLLSGIVQALSGNSGMTQVEADKFADELIANCITENVTLRRNVASGGMLLSDRHKSLLEERHDEPDKQTRIT